MFALVETAKNLILFKNQKIYAKYKFDDIYHAQKIYYDLLKGKLTNEIVDFLLENDVDKIIVDRTLLKLNKNKELKDIQFVENHVQLRSLRESIKMDHKSTRGLSHVIAQKNVNFFTLDPLIIQSYALYKQIELDMEKYDKRAMEIYLNYLPELKIKKKQIEMEENSQNGTSNEENTGETKSSDICSGSKHTAPEKAGKLENSHIQFKEQFNIDVIKKMWKIKERNDHNLKWVFTSVGIELSGEDWRNLERIIDLFNLKRQNLWNLKKYLLEKLKEHTPNLLALLGFKLTAEIISLTGSLINLSKCTAGTVQVLGAEKALFRSLKSKTPTPKYGILKNNDITTSPRIIRSLANKIVICARIDAFSEIKTNLYGVALRKAILKKVHNDVQIDTEEILRTVSQELKEKHTVPYQPKKDQHKTEDIKSKNMEKLQKQLNTEKSDKIVNEKSYHKKEIRAKRRKHTIIEETDAKIQEKKHRSKSRSRNSGVVNMSEISDGNKQEDQKPEKPDADKLLGISEKREPKKRKPKPSDNSE